MNAEDGVESIDSYIFVQASYKGWPDCGLNGEHSLVILSVSEGSLALSTEILR
jgi:hypothetical protein